MKQIQSMDIKVPVVGSNSYVTKIALDLAKDNAEGVYSVADYVHTNPAPWTVQFAANYKAKYKLESEFNSAMNYDAIYVIADAFKRAGTNDKKAMRDALASVKELVGVSTTYTFDANNVGGTSVAIVQVKKGAPQIIESVRGR
jgi:branched-chain amino acid transport system substrate-binding protein